MKIERSKDKIRNIIEGACAKKAMLVFVTPYLRLESSFAGISGDEVYASVSSGQRDALYSLRASDVRVRFPHRSGFWEWPAKILGFGSHRNPNVLALGMPKELRENDDRESFRVAVAGNLAATISTPNMEIVSASVLDVSVSGAKLSIGSGGIARVLKWGDMIDLTIPIPGIPTINTKAVVRHMDDFGFGVQYVPRLGKYMLESLVSWVFRKQEEEKERLALFGGSAEGREGQQTSAKSLECKVLIVTSDYEAHGAIKDALTDEMALLHSVPSVASMKNMLAEMPHLVVLHILGGNLETKRLMKALAALVPKGVPILLLGSDIDSSVLFELGREWGAAVSIGWARERGVLVQRLIVGLLRERFGAE
ncbi:MAG: PilZ domain-containing protein [Holophagales bacterium]|nr:PilZ domain-containing protein [Holophagales bacterium]